MAIIFAGSRNSFWHLFSFCCSVANLSSSQVSWCLPAMTVSYKKKRKMVLIFNPLISLRQCGFEKQCVNTLGMFDSSCLTDLSLPQQTWCEHFVLVCGISILRLHFGISPVSHSIVQTNWTGANLLCAIATKECFRHLDGPVAAGREKLWNQHELQTFLAVNGVHGTYSILSSVFTTPVHMPVDYYMGGTGLLLPSLYNKSIKLTIATHWHYT